MTWSTICIQVSCSVIILTHKLDCVLYMNCLTQQLIQVYVCCSLWQCTLTQAHLLLIVLACLLNNRDNIGKCLICVRHNTVSNVVDDSCSPQLVCMTYIITITMTALLWLICQIDMYTVQVRTFNVNHTQIFIVVTTAIYTCIATAHWLMYCPMLKLNNQLNSKQ